MRAEHRTETAGISTVLDQRYRIDGLIDRGGMADVYRARDLRLDREVAVKVLREVEHERRFAVEARTLARLQHPNLVRLLDAGTDDGSAYLVLELLHGATLKARLAKGPLEPHEVAEIGAQAAAALAYIHKGGIVHRDVKPSNLMLDEYRTVRLADFGIARLMGDTSLTGTQQTIGTMAYLAPEQLRGQPIGPPADVYSLGLVLIECLVGHRVFDGPPAEAAAARLSRDPDVATSLPAPWPALLRAMTARDPALRPRALEVHTRLAGKSAATPLLDAAGDDATVPAAAAAGAASATTAGAEPVGVERTAVAPTSVQPANARRREPRRRIPALLLAAALVIGALVALAAWRNGSGGGSHNPVATSVQPTSVAPATAAPATPPPPAPTAHKGEHKQHGEGNGGGNGEQGGD